MRIWRDLKVVLVLLAANGTPIVVKDILQQRLAYPLDAGARLPDGRPVFGKAKTVRGISASLAVTSVCAEALGLNWKIGLGLGAVAMAGDLCSSFVKRRMNVPASAKVTGLDQIPESLLPLLAVRKPLSLSMVDIGAGVALFFVGDKLLSMLSYRLHIREHPY